MNSFIKTKYSILVKIIGLTVVAISFIFIWRKIINLDLSIIIFHFNYLWLVYVAILSLFYALLVLLLSYNWYLLLEIIERKSLQMRVFTSIYLTTNLTKYIPSNLMQYLGRHTLGKKNLVSHSSIFLVNVLEIIYLLIICIVVISVSLLLNTLEIPIDIFGYINSKILLIMIFIMFVIVVAILTFKRPKGFSYLKNIFYGIDRKKLLLPMFYYFLFIGGIGFGLWLTFLLLFQLNPNLWIFIVAQTISWVIGFITPGAPGGLGVRESVLLILLSNTFDMEYVLVAALVFRLVSIFGDIIAFIFGIVLNRTSIAGFCL